MPLPTAPSPIDLVEAQRQLLIILITLRRINILAIGQEEILREIQSAMQRIEEGLPSASPDAEWN